MTDSSVSEKKRSTIDAISEMTKILDGFKEKTAAIFFNIKKAYDKVNRDKTLGQLENMKIQGRMLKFIRELIGERLIKVRVEGSVSQSKHRALGISQGRVLSVTFFLVAINGILGELRNIVDGSLFVDDMAIYLTTRNQRVAVRALQGVTKKLDAWAAERGLAFTPNKAVSMIFRKRRKRNEELIEIMLRNKIIILTN